MNMDVVTTTLPAITLDQLHATAERLKNWGRWGPDDEIGTLNHVTAADVVAASRLVRKGKTMSLALNFDEKGPQGGKSNYPAIGRFNPIHVMLRSGTDAYSGVLDHRKIRGADDIIIMPTQCGTQWDGLGHIFYGDKMWNGLDCRTVTSFGAQKCGIEKTRQKIVGRGVLLDIPMMLGTDYLPDGFGVTGAVLDQARAHRASGGKARSRQLGRLFGRRCAGPRVRYARLAACEAGCSDRHRHVGRRGAAKPDDRGRSAMALDRNSDHRTDGRRDLRHDRTVQGLCRGQHLRVPVRCAGAADHRSGRFADQSAGDQISQTPGSGLSNDAIAIGYAVVKE
jgi:hypothetical protein